MTMPQGMKELDQTAWEVLNATADDWENLEQIFRAVCFATAEAGPAGQVVLRPRNNAPLLEEVAERVSQLMESGLLEAREPGGPAAPGDGRYVWRAWFRMTPAGREAWSGSGWARLAEGSAPGGQG